MVSADNLISKLVISLASKPRKEFQTIFLKVLFKDYSHLS